MPPPSCVSLFNAVCNTFNLPPRPPSSALCASIPRATFEEGGPFLVFLATRVFALLARHACSRIRCPLYDYAFVFCSIFFSPVLFSLPSLPLFYANIPRVRIFVSRPLSLPPLSPRWKIKCENVVEKERWGGGDFNRLNRASRGGGRGRRVSLFNLKTYRFVSRFRAIYRFDFSRC